MLYDQVLNLLQNSFGAFEERKGRMCTRWSRMERILDQESRQLSASGAKCPGLH